MFLKLYGDTEGPLGFPMKDADAKSLDDILKQHPEAEYCRLIVPKATAELAEGERADVSWIQTEAIDHEKEIVLASGFKDTSYAANPIVTINHQYYRPPIGKSLWRRRLKDGDRRGVKAKTQYPTRPAEWNADETWAPDAAWALVKSGLMNGKSIGFLTIKAHAPTEEEVRKRPELAQCSRIVDEWLLLEYACCWMPINPEAAVESVSKSHLSQLGIDLPEPKREPIPFTPLENYQEAIERAVKSALPEGYIDRLVSDAIDRLRGRV